MKKRATFYIVVLLVLTWAANLLRKLELLTVLDDAGLAVFKPVTAVLIVLCVLVTAFCVLFVRKTVPANGPGEAERYPGLGLSAVVCAAVCLLVQLYGAWLLFQDWKRDGSALDLILALLAGLAGAGWLSLRLTEWKVKLSAGTRLLAGSLVTLFYCLWLIVYYRDEAPEPSLILTVYGFLALCASCVAAYYIAGGCVGKLRPRSTPVICGLALFLSMVAQVRGEEPSAFRLFWLAGAMQFALSAFVLLCDPLPEPEAPPEEEPAPEPGEGEGGPAPSELPAEEAAEPDAGEEG